MIREKLTIKASGNTKLEIIDSVENQIKQYLDLETEEELSKFADIELDICADNGVYNATAYVRIKN